MSSKLSNYDKFPSNIFRPVELFVDNDVYILYLARFNGIYDIYSYLKNDPKINRRVFKKLSSVTGITSFAGKPYEEALEDLISDYDSGYDEFLRLQKDINKSRSILINKYKTVRTLAGGHLNIPAYSAGSPLCYETIERIEKPKFVKIHVNLSYSWMISHKQVFNKAIIVTNIIKSLEKAGYSVEVNTFKLIRDGDEIFHLIVQLKKHGGKLNIVDLYKSLCNVEFSRRISFRILETMNVCNEWDGYGSVLSESFVRRVLKLNEDDLYIGTPNELGIGGKDISVDFENAIRYLNLEDKIDMEKAKNEFKEVKVLKRRRD